MAYLALLVVAALDAAGYSVIAPVMPEIGERTGAGPGTAGALAGTFALGQLIAFPVAGRALVHRHSASVIAVALVLIAVGDLAFAFTERLEVFFPGRLLQGFGAGGLWMGVTFGVLERFPGDEYRRMTGVLGAYSVGGVAGPALGGVEGIRAPFLLHLGLVVVAGGALLLLGRPETRPAFQLDRTTLRTPVFRLACAAILLIALGYGILDGPMPLHFGERLGQTEIAALYVFGSLAVGVAAALAGRTVPLAALVWGCAGVTVGLALAALVTSVPVWIVAVALTAIGFGFGEAGALGAMLDEIGVERIVVAMVVWSQVWGVGYLVGPVVAGVVADLAGFAWLGLVPLATGVVVVVALVQTRRAAVVTES